MSLSSVVTWCSWWYAQYLLLLCKLSPTAWSSMCLQNRWPSIFSGISNHTICSTISLDDCVRLLKSLVNNYWLDCRLDLCTITFQFRTPEPSEVVSINSYCLCRGQEYIVHNLHCFWQIRMVSVWSVTDSTDWSLPYRIIGSTRGLLTPSIRTGTSDSEVCDSHTTIRPRELPQCFQSRRSSQDSLYKDLHLVTLYTCRVLVHCSSSVLPLPLSSFVWSRTKDPDYRRHRR